MAMSDKVKLFPYQHCSIQVVLLRIHSFPEVVIFFDVSFCLPDLISAELWPFPQYKSLNIPSPSLPPLFCYYESTTPRISREKLLKAKFP